MKQKYLSAFMDMTERFAQTSEAKRLKVGACLIKNGNPVCFGVNGTPSGWHSNVCEGDDGLTLDCVSHAEINCLNKLRRLNESAEGGTLLITHACCVRCAHEIADSGIEHVIYKNEYRLTNGLDYLKSKGIQVFNNEDHD